ncbi:Nramp family divalent metal transporter [Paenibacillus sp. TRM 82003]|uniref:Nramp family divalent metal transporter n=1 Tax=Kineococcus sp. TRM81007 TaxID=2925831 RepID=UPI001F55F208|nr:Nramp family divalent metal transporter [Kineococcus sp. TRM81007]MCI2239516.1 Nramp family divalent metal transporter [Kineococcus sp. TRM81007]MCI3926203.1 Nramp family divalent metal transporter [Paenibacillus sp. TRM 82003]
MTTDAPPAEQENTRTSRAGLLRLLGPAFVASIAYVDPGNVAANLTAGARYGYLLLWVLVAANAMAVLVQYLSAKLSVVTGRTLPELLRERLGRPARLAYWGQAELVAIATDLAEVIGGAVALNLLFGTPLLTGGVITGAASLLLLALHNRAGVRWFEAAVVALLLVVVAGFVSGVVLAPPDAGEAAAGLVPRFAGADTVLLAASMLGATVMPHAIYLHSAMARDHHGEVAPARRRRVLAATRVDVLAALVLAGLVNISMLLLAASALRGVPGTDTLEGAHAAVLGGLGTGAALLFAIGLLASGLASTSVGAYAGSIIMQGLLRIDVPLLVRRAVTLVPALVCLGVGVDPTRALVVSQVVLSFGIPFALVPLVRLTGSRELMGEHVNRTGTRAVAIAAVALVVALNAALLYLTFTA